MSKLIINTDGVPDELALRLALKVIEHGRVSNNGKCYCYVTTFETEQGPAGVFTGRTRAGTDTFHVCKLPEQS